MWWGTKIDKYHACASSRGHLKLVLLSQMENIREEIGPKFERLAMQCEILKYMLSAFWSARLYWQPYQLNLISLPTLSLRSHEFGWCAFGYNLVCWAWNWSSRTFTLHKTLNFQRLLWTILPLGKIGDFGNILKLTFMDNTPCWDGRFCPNKRGKRGQQVFIGVPADFPPWDLHTKSPLLWPGTLQKLWRLNFCQQFTFLCFILHELWSK